MKEAANTRKYNILNGSRYLGTVMLNDSADGTETIASVIAVKHGLPVDESNWADNTVQLVAFFPAADTDMYILDTMINKAGIQKETYNDFHIRRGMMHAAEV